MEHTKIKNALVSWVGGKSQLCKTIIPQIPKHTCYVEPFVGGGLGFLEKEVFKG